MTTDGEWARTITHLESLRMTEERREWLLRDALRAYYEARIQHPSVFAKIKVETL